MALINCSECSKQVSSIAVSCPHCGSPIAKDIELKKQEISKKILIKTYKGNQQQAYENFQADSTIMANCGFFPINQQYTQGAYGCGAFIMALLLCTVAIGFIIFIYMIIVKPEGCLSVTYEKSNGIYPQDYSEIEQKDSERKNKEKDRLTFLIIILVIVGIISIIVKP